MEVSKVPVSLIDRDPSQPRQDFKEDDLQSLAQSIETNGLLTPIALRRNGGGRFQIIAGERRFRAAQRLGWADIPATIHEVDENGYRKLQLLENVVRRDLNPVEMARAYKLMMDEGMSAKDIADAIGQDAGNVSYYVAILDARPEVIDLLAKGQLKIQVARSMARITPNGQLRLLRSFQLHNYGFAEQCALCDAVFAEENQTEMFVDAELGSGEHRLVAGFLQVFCALLRQFQKLEKMEKAKPGTVGSMAGVRAKAMRMQVKALQSNLTWLDKVLRQKAAAIEVKGD